jgi:hypothetical protein
MAGGGGGPGTVIIPWYATGFRDDGLAAALNEIAPMALRYGATSYGVYRSRDDLYKFQQLGEFPDHVSWERYWYGPEMGDFRTRYSGWYQVPVLYTWWELTSHGQLVPAPPATAGNGHGNGHGNGIAAERPR